MKIFILVPFLGFLLNTHAQDFSAEQKKSFCHKRTDSYWAQHLLKNSKNLLNFKNPKGHFRIGVCWWHSRFQRNATYLTSFAPNKRKPLNEWIDKKRDIPKKGSLFDILYSIRKMKKVVLIPGFSNLAEFSKYYKKEIIQVINRWQIKDALLYQSWTNGLWGKTKNKAKNLEEKMHQLYERIQSGEVVFQKLQIRGPAAHSWLVIGMEKISNGYQIEYIDSNESEVQTYLYEFGDRFFEVKKYSRFIAYTQRSKDLVKLNLLIDDFCKTLR